MFLPYWPIIRQHNKGTELSSCLYQSGTVNSSNMSSCLKLLYSSVQLLCWLMMGLYGLKHVAVSAFCNITVNLTQLCEVWGIELW